VKKAAKRKVVRSQKSRLKPKNSLLLFALLIIVLVGIAVWAVIANNPGKTPFALTPQAPTPTPAPSLSVSWGMPIGYAIFADVNNKSAVCFSANSTCSTAANIYWPGSTVRFTVKVSSANGPVLQSGTTIATPDGRAVANWSWKYEVNVFPDSSGSCANAGVKCVKGLVNNNMFVATNLLPSTIYRMIVCSPVCTGGMIIQNTTAKTADVPTSNSWTLNQPTISTANGVNFTFNPVSNGNISLIVESASTVLRTTVYDSGPIPSGRGFVVWPSAKSGDYTAKLVFATSAVSNTVKFNVPSGITSPKPVVDSDLDGCSDVKEAGNDWKLGGQRDLNNRWDFWDVPVPAISATNWNLPASDPGRPKMDRVITGSDAQAVFAYSGTKKGGPANAAGFSYDTHYGYQMGLTSDPNFTDGMFYDRTPSADSTQFWRTGPPRGVISAATAQLEMSLYQRGGSNCN